MAKDKQQKVNRAKQDAKKEQNAPETQNAAAKEMPAKVTMIGEYKPLPKFKGCRNC